MRPFSRKLPIPTGGTTPTPLGINPDTVMWSMYPHGGSPNAVRLGGPEVRVSGPGIYVPGLFTCGSTYPGDPCPGTDQYVISDTTSVFVNITEIIAERGDPEWELRHNPALRARRVA